LRVSRFAAALAVLVIADAVVSDLWSARDEIGFAHEICAQHGARTHVRTSASASRSQATISPGVDARAGARFGRVGGATPERHEHCAVALDSDLREPAPSVRASLRLSPPPLVAAPAPARARPLRSARRLLAAAPKTSPPRA
jgi:hypothetical protein